MAKWRGAVDLPELPLKYRRSIATTQVRDRIESEVLFDQIGHEISGRGGVPLNVGFNRRRLQIADRKVLAANQLAAVDDEADELIVG